MNIRQPKTVKLVASRMLSRASQRKQILMIFCGILLALCLAVTALNYVLDNAMAQSGGLGNLGTRSILSTFQTLLPFANMLAQMVLELGLLAAMLRISRGQFTSPQTLRTGLARFWPMLRCLLLQVVLYLIVSFTVMNVAMMFFFLSPMCNRFMELMTPMLTSSADTQAIMNAMLADEALLMALFDAVLPIYVIALVLILAAVIPISYRLRLANFVLLDDPRAGGFRALLESFKMTRRNWMPFLKLDLSFWWYYVLLFLSEMLSFGNLFLALLGIGTPLSADMEMYLFYGLYLAAQISIFYFLRPKVSVSTALIYNAIRPKEETQGQVLGNIFQM